MELILGVIETALSQIKWRLKPSSKRRLQTDILGLCSKMRPCVMVDYGGKLPELRDHLCAFISYCKKESPDFELLNLMIIDDMVYLIQVKELRDFVTLNLDMENPVLFVDIEHDPPKMITPTQKNNALEQLLSAQKLLISFFQSDVVVHDYLHRRKTSVESSAVEVAQSQSLEFMDLSFCLEESQVTIPTLNGWLLGYPIIYLFSKDHIEDAVCNLSTKSLHIYQIFVNRENGLGKANIKEELLSFTVPIDMSTEGANEVWAHSFLSQMKGKCEKCREFWRSVDMEVVHCSLQAIAL